MKFRIGLTLAIIGAVLLILGLFGTMAVNATDQVPQALMWTVHALALIGEVIALTGGGIIYTIED